MQFRFGDHVLDVERRELGRGGRAGLAGAAGLRPAGLPDPQSRPRADQATTSSTTVWGGRIVSDSTVTSRINAARRAVGDSGEAQRLIRTVPRKGIRFVGEITDEADGPGAGHRRQDRPSIAVLPFANLSDDRAQDYFADGIVAEIITGLSRIKWLLGDLAQFELHLQGQVGRREDRRPRARRPLRARRQRAPRPATMSASSGS